ncbi:unnamed protein product [Gordionus sp. m RMFG-2023]
MKLLESFYVISRECDSNLNAKDKQKKYLGFCQPKLIVIATCSKFRRKCGIKLVTRHKNIRHFMTTATYIYLKQKLIALYKKNRGEKYFEEEQYRLLITGEKISNQIESEINIHLKNPLSITCRLDGSVIPSGISISYVS